MIRVYLYILSIFFITPWSVIASQGDSLFNAAISLAEQGQFDQAVPVCQKAAAALVMEGKLEDWVAAHSFAARCAMRSTTYSLIDVRDMLEHAIEQAPLDEHDFRLGRLYLYYGWFLANRLYDFYRAKEAYETTKIIAARHGTKDPDVFVSQTPGKDIYKPLAQIYIRLGESEKALALMNLAVEEMKKNEQVYDLPELFADWGILHHDLEQDERALKRYQEGLDGLEAAFGGQNLDADAEEFFRNTKGLLLSNQAQSLLELGNLPEARIKCTEALGLLNWEDYRAAGLSVWGHIVEEEQGPAQAIPFFEEAVTQAAQYFPFYSRRIAKIENELARLYRSQGDWALALKWSHKALSRVVPGLGQEDWAQLPDPKNFYPENTIMEVLTEKANIFRSWYDQNGEAEQLELARRHYELAIQMEEVLNSIYTYQSSMLSLAGQSHARHEAMMDIVFELYDQTKDARWVEEAFTYMEKSRAVILNRALADDRAIQISADEKLFEREKALQAQLTDYQRLLFELRMEKADTHQIASVNRELFQLKEQYDQLIAEFQQQNQAYYQLRHQQSLAGLSDLQNKLSADALFVSYFWGKEKDQLYILAVGGEQPPQFFQKKLSENFDFDLSEFIRRLKDWNFVLNNEGDPGVLKEFVQQSSQFYQLLFPETIKATEHKRIILVPDGLLNLLPFDVLLTEEVPGPVDYAGLNYLIKSSAVSYAFSGTIMLGSEKDGRKKRLKNYLGMAPDYSGHGLGLSPVANNQQAVERYRRQLGGKALLGKDATIQSFLKEAARSRILHFYGHAKAYPSQPASSWMAFSTEGAAPVAESQQTFVDINKGLLDGDVSISGQDLEGLLFIFELYKLDLNAELTVLSACETGVGKVALGEGVISLARAFRYAGCPSTLMSLWEANDYQGEVAFLMEEFFTNLKDKKMSKDEAIRQAKLTFLADPKKSSHPAYWASFVMLGDNDPIVWGSPFRFWWIIPLLILGVVLGRLAGKLRQRSLNL